MESSVPRQAKGARLYLKPAEIDPRTRQIRKHSTWIVRDGAGVLSTGCDAQDREGAERVLAVYLAEKFTPNREKGRQAAAVTVAEVLALYQEEVVPNHARPGKSDERLLQLGEWWGDKTLADVTGKTCRAYTAWRVGQPWKSAKPEVTGRPARVVTAAGARRELEDLRSAINHHRAEGYCREVVEVVLPDRSEAATRWLTRSEAAHLIWTCWRHREVQNGKPTAKRPWRHIARFIIAGLYTGTRASAICTAALSVHEGSGYVDLERGVFYRRQHGRAETNKRQPPARLPPRLLAHMRRWAADRGEDTVSKNFVVEYNGSAVGEVNKGFAAAVAAAGLGPDVTPHTLRHTAATWTMQAGADIWDVAGYLGMSVATLERVYGHHHPDHQSSAIAAITSKPRREQKVSRGQGGVRNTGNETR